MSGADDQFMLRAIELAREGVEAYLGGPFGCVIVKDGRIVGEGCNRVTSTSDPTAHAEMVAIRAACTELKTFQLSGCTIYTSCEPCPMCLGAMYWSRPDRVFFAGTRQDAANSGFDDQLLYEELELAVDKRRLPMSNILREQAQTLFQLWDKKTDKTAY